LLNGQFDGIADAGAEYGLRAGKRALRGDFDHLAVILRRDE
jgi:hypothetical protein